MKKIPIFAGYEAKCWHTEFGNYRAAMVHHGYRRVQRAHVQREQ